MRIAKNEPLAFNNGGKIPFSKIAHPKFEYSGELHIHYQLLPPFWIDLPTVFKLKKI